LVLLEPQRFEHGLGAEETVGQVAAEEVRGQLEVPQRGQMSNLRRQTTVQVVVRQAERKWVRRMDDVKKNKI
jgi:hypothetical protein